MRNKCTPCILRELPAVFHVIDSASCKRRGGNCVSTNISFLRNGVDTEQPDR
ncbi:MAG: hypothetical protein LBC68_09205 [Prevotellaceae bacterium]|nr:hypothetical protein [Prevotellaceae bacterium]